ncbi:cytochrome c oxidase subunit 3 [Longimicrobium sp.]|uniref:cytochrome c oxidase subunit 3 n=1 Tax=Longimicrobium sp. TaxID=2029185 RepID=UPI002E373021|nr:cytochrome c oxidase subunit 3 [Longimicrobium sp.]HEX6042810.1 cytochrome c oxidase subunit 3 [Longimicrobium sp.]
MSAPRTGIDVSALSTVVFGKRTVLWWGTLGFMIIEGFTLVLMIASYLYLRQNEFDWPPGRTPQPDLLIPTINTVLLLAVIIPMRRADRAAKRMDRAAVVPALWIATGMTVVVNVLRWFELMALNVKWDAHAYGSAAWGVVVLHSTLIVVDVFETGTIAALFMTGKARRKHYPDVSDAAFYQYFLSLAWIPVYLVVYWGPRVL